MIEALTDADIVRELAWAAIDATPAEDPNATMNNDQFDQEVEAVAGGGWEEVGLDRLPEDWQSASIEELRNVG